MKWPRRSKARCNRFFCHISATFYRYEIILMDNGSAKVLDEPTQKILPNLNYIYLMREALQL
jgi:hypothetical protein